MQYTIWTRKLHPWNATEAERTQAFKLCGWHVRAPAECEWPQMRFGSDHVTPLHIYICFFFLTLPPRSAFFLFHSPRLLHTLQPTAEFVWCALAACGLHFAHAVSSHTWQFGSCKSVALQKMEINLLRNKERSAQSEHGKMAQFCRGVCVCASVHATEWA